MWKTGARVFVTGYDSCQVHRYGAWGTSLSDACRSRVACRLVCMTHVFVWGECTSGNGQVASSGTWLMRLYDSCLCLTRDGRHFTMRHSFYYYCWELGVPTPRITWPRSCPFSRKLFAGFIGIAKWSSVTNLKYRYLAKYILQICLRVYQIFKGHVTYAMPLFGKVICLFVGIAQI